jgi:hypothetical protein
MTGWLCVKSNDPLTWLFCNANGTSGIAMNPQAWGTDVVSVNGDGTIARKPSATGDNENFDLVGGYALSRTPMPTPNFTTQGARTPETRCGCQDYVEDSHA